MAPTRRALPHEKGEDGILTITAFEGAITVRVLEPGERAFLFDAVFQTRHRHFQGAPKPPEHFHPFQDEYMTVLEGTLIIEVEGVQHVVKAGDPEFTVRRGVNHRLYPPRRDEGPPAARAAAEEQDVIRVLLSGEQTSKQFKLDLVFFENWYAYQDMLVVQKARLNLLQVLSMFDAGDSYLTLPRWVPFRAKVSRIAGVVGGRWIGGLLGYQPFYKEWTTEWDIACEKMESSLFLRRFSDRRNKK
ncbi:cf2c73a1-daf1-4c72-9e18-3249709aec9e [Thermothielavioides terrestris]|uniref:Cupin type-2 domain-containing protein n=2 Tax=Thermothielavioides terrestris TaxID=2587410 RepID=G2RDX1_THETT|nr:uncharacterized protein THITE_2056962 [Thermothielavioides terrestris NRRL 8126]AEO70854.1 hypothetical protein THITE_2056962 [Thermothielavioides terrestris NRRL 8126]SPQ25162.1 cf2c73a1-daf1-4c72-9e18-3249709aec9e [Thermothielavioides terrestris]